MKIGILGTRGIPNHHGGFEQFAEYFAVYAAEQGHEVYVYNSSLHPYKNSTFRGVKLVHCRDSEDKIGTAGQFFYDLNCMLDARKRNFDVLLQLGYTSNAIWYKFLPKKVIVATNMDGLEWKRSKYSPKIQKFLKWSEKLAVKSSDFLIADSKGIQSYLKEKYQKEAEFIAYGAMPFDEPKPEILSFFSVEAFKFHMLIARMEPENNIETILDGYVLSDMKFPFLVVGDAQKTSFGKKLLAKFKDINQIRFLGAIYDLDQLNNLRYYSQFYFHGHSVGGTNPSLLEAMASQAHIVAHQNKFNAAILENDAYYFQNSQEVASILKGENRREDFIKNNFQKIEKTYNWPVVNQQYLNFLMKIGKNKHSSL